MKLVLYIVSILFFLNSCSEGKRLGTTDDIKDDLILAKIDSVSLDEIKQYETSEKSIFDFYKTELEDQIAIWSDKMFGRCCSEADLKYSDLLSFDITSNINSVANPEANLSDTKYGTTFAFKENQNPEIYLKLNRTSELHAYHAGLSVDGVLKSNDTILKPFRLSLVNGSVKSSESFDQNGRIKAFTVFLDDNYVSTVLLKDTPLVQEFMLDITFYRNSIIKLIPVSYFKGSTTDDICISEIQSSLAHTTYSSINEKYVINELLKK